MPCDTQVYDLAELGWSRFNKVFLNWFVEFVAVRDANYPETLEKATLGWFTFPVSGRSLHVSCVLRLGGWGACGQQSPVMIVQRDDVTHGEAQ